MANPTPDDEPYDFIDGPTLDDLAEVEAKDNPQPAFPMTGGGGDTPLHRAPPPSSTRPEGEVMTEQIRSVGDVADYVTQAIARLDERKAAGEQFIKEVDEVVEQITYKDGFTLDVVMDELGEVWIEVVCWRPDAITGVYNYGYGGRRRLSSQMTRSDVVRNIFAAYKAYEEHECREFFRYRGEQVFGPHMDLDDLAQKMADSL